MRAVAPVALAILAGCAAPAESQENAPAVSTAAADRAIKEIDAIEERLGGRLGVSLVDGSGHALLTHRGDERFAMCSTFKAPLAAAIMLEVEQGRLSLDQQISFTPDDVVPHAPMIERALEGQTEASRPVDWLVLASMRASDNSAANILLDRIGGPEGMTRFYRDHGDGVTRLDRREPELNENNPGDPRDTTSPLAMAQLIHRVMLGDAVHPGLRAILVRHMVRTDTGLSRIRAGLPEGWVVGDKTGTCGSAYNDVAIFWAERDRPYALSIYFDRPEAGADEAQAAMAEVGALAAEVARQR
ncbi:class A beta-lactamase [Qipengyuania flava]|nr:class A beta-lactamase [Qipengyuania flava]